MLDPFYLIVDSSDWIARLLPCGVRLVQLRVKDAPDDDLRAEIGKREGALRTRRARNSSSMIIGITRSTPAAISSISARSDLDTRRSSRHPPRRYKARRLDA